MSNYFIAGVIVGTIVTTALWLINRWYWKGMYESERQYSDKLKNLFERDHPTFKIRREKS